MTPEKLARIERAGFSLTTVQEAFGLTDAEMAEIDALIAAEKVNFRSLDSRYVPIHDPDECTICRHRLEARAAEKKSPMPVANKSR